MNNDSEDESSKIVWFMISGDFNNRGLSITMNINLIYVLSVHLMSAFLDIIKYQKRTKLKLPLTKYVLSIFMYHSFGLDFVRLSQEKRLTAFNKT